MDRRELRYMRMYGKYLGSVFVMLERQSKIVEGIIMLASLVLVAGISYLVGIGFLAISTTTNMVGLLRFWAFGKGFMVSFSSLIILAFIVGFVYEIYKAYRSVRFDYARKEKE